MTVETDKTAVRSVIAAVLQGLHDRDATAVTGHYAGDATIYDLAPPLSHPVDPAGLAAWIATWKGPLKRESRELGLSASGDLAVWNGYFRTEATTAGGETAGWWERATIVLQRDGDGWKIVHEHTSVPFHMDGSFRAATDLAP